MLPVLRALAPWSAVLSVVALSLASAELGASAPPSHSSPELEAPLEAEADPPSAPLERAPIFTRSGASSAPPGSPTAGASCPPEMQRVEGSYCPEVEQRCLRYLDSPKARFGTYRCAVYAPSRCLSPQRTPLRFCIDRDEHVTAGASLPDNDVSLRSAEKSCAREGKRVCRESEWNFACEGEQMSPYPYGFERDASACNTDHGDLVDDAGKLRDKRAAAGAHPRCVSPSGVRDLSGNLEEVVARDGPGPTHLALKGAYWQPSRNHCRAAQYGHDAWYHGTETGYRCCSDLGN
ncbi:MAG: SUMF1/EgtB/PvdO family nonheme iron enzyme [Myxococcales bacterium]|nr:SUMF1/EgtB/PvdO family nonheme iron enzyme [Myxococcales bacterium]